MDDVDNTGDIFSNVNALADGKSGYVGDEAFTKVELFSFGDMVNTDVKLIFGNNFSSTSFESESLSSRHDMYNGFVLRLVGQGC